MELVQCTGGLAQSLPAFALWQSTAGLLACRSPLHIDPRQNAQWMTNLSIVRHTDEKNGYDGVTF